MTEVVDLVTALLLMAAMFRRPSWITLVLGVGYLFSVWSAMSYHHDDLRPLLLAVDAMVVASCSIIWRKTGDYHARLVGGLSILAVIFTMYCVAFQVRWNTYAATQNLIVALQILIAGGFSDGFLAWVGYSFSGTATDRRVHSGLRSKA